MRLYSTRSGAVWVGTLPVSIATDRVDEQDGQVSVTLNTVTTGLYQYNTRTQNNDNVGKVSVKDTTVPVITVENIDALAGTECDIHFNVGY